MVAETTDVRLARIEEMVGGMSKRLDTLVESSQSWTPGDGSPFVTKDAFAPVRMIAFGLVGLVMVGFVGAVVALIWKQ